MRTRSPTGRGRDGIDRRTSQEKHNTVRPFTGIPALFHDVIHRAIADSMWVLGEYNSIHPSSRKRMAEAAEDQVEAYNYLFGDDPWDAVGRKWVCDHAGIDAQYFEEALPCIKVVVDTLLKDEYYVYKDEKVDAKWMSRYISNMFVRQSRDDSMWQEILEQ